MLSFTQTCILMQELEDCDVGEDFDVDGILTERVEPCVSTHPTQKLYMKSPKNKLARGRKLLSLMYVDAGNGRL